MMMGFGLVFMLLIALLVIGLPVLLVALLAGGGLAAVLRPRPSHDPAPAPPTAPAIARQCPTCGHDIRPGWQVCPFCGTALT